MSIDMNAEKPKTTTQRPVTGGRRSRLAPWALGALTVLALSFFGGWMGAARFQDSSGQTVHQQKTILTNESNLISQIASQVGQSVVSVNVTAQSTDVDTYGGFFGYGVPREQQSAGTGVIIDDEGVILTNRHVVPEGTTDISVTLNDGTVLEKVTVIGRTSPSDSLDIAFLKINDKEGHRLRPASIGDSSKVDVGDSVVAIGNALGQFQNTVTMGIISGYGRSVQASSGGGSSVESLDDLFQTDAAINEGNSGGPLVNLSGEVIGINTAIAGNAQNIGFAIPINDVKGLISSVVEKGKLEKPYLGVVYVMITDDIAKQYDLAAKRGVYIPKANELNSASSSVLADGPAAKAGVKEGDIITKVNGKEINEKTSLVSQLSQRKVGDKVTLTILRDGKTMTVDVQLGAAPSN